MKKIARVPLSPEGTADTFSFMLQEGVPSGRGRAKKKEEAGNQCR
jgi:hypothetical protein